MPDTMISQDLTDKLYVMSGDFTTTVRVSIDVTATGRTHPDDISRDVAGNTPWADFQTDVLVLSSGAVTSTVKTSISPGKGNLSGCSDDEDLNTYTSADAGDIMYYLSGQFTTTVRDSENVTAIDTLLEGVCWDGVGENMIWVGDEAEKLYLQSGRFDSTLKTSQAITLAATTAPQGVGFDGTDTLTGWITGTDKLAKYSGQFTSTVKDSSIFNSATGNYRGVETADVASRLSVIYSSGDDLVIIGRRYDKLFHTSGTFTTTIKDSESVTAIEATPDECGWDGTNTPWSGINDDKLYLTSGRFTSTLKDSDLVSSINTIPRGGPDDGSGNTCMVGATATQKGYIISGQFTTTIKDSEDISLIETGPIGASTDGADFFVPGATDDKIYKWSGLITSTIKDSQANSWDTNTACCSPHNDNVYVAGFATQIVKYFSGSFTTTVKSSMFYGGIEDQLTSAATGDATERLTNTTHNGIADMQSSSSLTASATVVAGWLSFQTEAFTNITFKREALTPYRR